MTNRFTKLDFGLSLLASMYHQDWREDGDHRAVLETFLWEDQAPAAVSALRRDAIGLGHLADASIEALWTAVTDGNFIFGSDVGSASAWMDFIVECCGRWLTRHGMPESAPDVEVRDAGIVTVIVDEVRALSSIGGSDDEQLSTVWAGLIECANSGSADLAFRLLLRVIDSHRIRLSRENYARLVSIGEELDHGEFVVSAVEHLTS